MFIIANFIIILLVAIISSAHAYREGRDLGRHEGWNRAKYGIPYRNSPEREKYEATGWTFNTAEDH